MPNPEKHILVFVMHANGENMQLSENAIIYKKNVTNPVISEVKFRKTKNGGQKYKIIFVYASVQMCRKYKFCDINCL